MPKLKARSKAGSFKTFLRRYDPIQVDDTIMRSWRDPDVHAADVNYVWTIVDGDNGKLYLVTGFATVNYVGRVLCRKPWPEEEESLPGYVY